MLKELIEYGDNIKKTQEKMMFTLNEMQKNLQRTNCAGDEAGIESNDLELIVEINVKSEQQEEKKELKKPRINIRNFWDLYYQMYQYLNHRDARKRRGRERN